MKNYLLLSSLVIIVMLAACKKDNNTDQNSAGIEGTYKFKYIDAKTKSTVTGSFGEKIITNSDYTTTNNQGTLVFNSSSLSATGLTYTVTTQAKYYLYDGTDLVDSSSYPFTFTLPATNSTAQYKLIGSDSIYFPQGSLTSGVSGSGSTQTIPSGGRYSWNGSLLTITQNVSRDSTFKDSGETIYQNESAVTSIVLEKQ